jgi:cytochrome c biogenesis factor
MKKFFDILFSMQTMGVLILIFAFSLGAATFIENDFGTTAAKALIYNAVWFDVLLAILSVNLAGNIILFRMYRRKKFTLFLFHFAFLIIIAGAAITRFISYEGTMHIREGESSNTMLSDRTYVTAEVTYKGQTKKHEKKVLLSVFSKNDYSDQITVSGKTFKFTTADYIPNATEIITETENGIPYAVLVASTGMVLSLYLQHISLISYPQHHMHYVLM